MLVRLKNDYVHSCQRHINLAGLDVWLSRLRSTPIPERLATLYCPRSTGWGLDYGLGTTCELRAATAGKSLRIYRPLSNYQPTHANPSTMPNGQATSAVASPLSTSFQPTHGHPSDRPIA